jgi:cysteine desulfurase family protein (TIGR01976 family)
MTTVDELRAQFPTIRAGRAVYLDNAGGSQAPRCVADAIRDYMLNTYVQLGADYEVSRASTAVVDRAHEFIELFVHAGDRGRVILASSTTVLCAILADCYARARPGGRDEIIVAETAHEANAGPWFRLADRGWKVQPWRVAPDSLELDLAALRKLLSNRTLLVAFPHVSNVLGRIEDAGAIARLAHEAGARVVVDGVAYAPHRAIDVAAIGADWYVYSTYKVFGPHMAAMFGSHDALAQLEGPNHFFIPRGEIPYKFEPGGASHEGCAGLLALWEYLAAVAGADPTADPSRAVIEQAYRRFAEWESRLLSAVLDFLNSRPQLRIIGPTTRGADRVATISFVHARRRSADIARAANAEGYGIRFGHFYAYRLCDRLAREGVLHDVDDGVVRVSLLHYNTLEEIDGLIACLDRLL